jgi:hypothetical protein
MNELFTSYEVPLEADVCRHKRYMDGTYYDLIHLSTPPIATTVITYLIDKESNSI